MAPGYTPLTSPSYPIFNKYPKFIVDYQVFLIIIVYNFVLIINIDNKSNKQMTFHIILL